MTFAIMIRPLIQLEFLSNKLLFIGRIECTGKKNRLSVYWLNMCFSASYQFQLLPHMILTAMIEVPPIHHDTLLCNIEKGKKRNSLTPKDGLR